MVATFSELPGEGGGGGGGGWICTLNFLKGVLIRYTNLQPREVPWKQFPRTRRADEHDDRLYSEPGLRSSPGNLVKICIVVVYHLTNIASGHMLFKIWNYGNRLHSANG